MTSYADLFDDIYAALNHASTGVGVNVSADLRQRGEVIPAVVFAMDDAEFTRHAGGAVAPVFCRVQIDCMHDSRLQSQQLAKNAKAAVAASSLVHSVETESNDLFNRGADLDPVYVTSALYVFTCSTV